MYSNRFVQTAVHTTARTAINSAVYGTDFADSLRENLKTAAIDEVAAMGAGEIGDEFASGSMAGGPGSVDYWLHKGSHAALGCATASAKGGDCASGAFGGVAGETFAGIYGKEMGQKANTALSRISTVFAASAAGHDINDADATASNSIKNNCWNHPESCFGDKGFADTMRGLLTGEYFGGDADGPATDEQITSVTTAIVKGAIDQGIKEGGELSGKISTVTGVSAAACTTPVLASSCGPLTPILGTTSAIFGGFEYVAKIYTNSDPIDTVQYVGSHTADYFIEPLKKKYPYFPLIYELSKIYVNSKIDERQKIEEKKE